MNQAWAVFVLTVSDRAAAGTREDASGPALAARIAASGFRVLGTDVVADGESAVGDRLRTLARSPGVDCVVTTGGTGLAPRDRTPEATLAVADRQVPGLMELARQRCSQITPFACLSRGVAADVEGTLVLNVPGHPKAAVETFDAVADVLPHALKILRSTPTDCDITGGTSAEGEGLVS